MKTSKDWFRAFICFSFYRVMLMSRKFETTGIKQVHFAMSDSKEFAREISDLGLSNSGNLPVAAVRDAHERRYVMSTPFRYATTFVCCSLKMYLDVCTFIVSLL